MSFWFMLFSMIFCHIIADFHVQNDFMAKYKQSKNWEEFGPKYVFDYIPMLIVHSFSWSFVTFLPLLYAVYKNIIDINTWCAIVMFNTTIHMIIDDLKCNKLKINLIVDQLLHLAQILGMTLLVYYS